MPRRWFTSKLKRAIRIRPARPGICNKGNSLLVYMASRPKEGNIPCKHSEKFKCHSMKITDECVNGRTAHQLFRLNLPIQFAQN